jgi:hypothetical protein
MIFDWFKSREERMKDYNVVKFPAAPPAPAPPKERVEHYSIGVTSDDRITLKMGYTTLTMNEAGVRNLIEQLELFADQLTREEKK